MSRWVTKPTMKVMEHRGMVVEAWTYRSCSADFGVGDDWATLYMLLSARPGKGHATSLLRFTMAHYQAKGKVFGGSIALSDEMRRLYEKLGIIEYTQEYVEAQGVETPEIAMQADGRWVANKYGPRRVAA